MANSIPPMPRFEAPPVVETVMGVHFQPLPSFDFAARVAFYSQHRDQFPKLEEKGSVEDVSEEFGEGNRTGMQIRWQILEAPPSPRLWAKSLDGKHTIQFQQDALIVNWERDFEGPDTYWRYADRRRDFVDKLASLDQFLRDNQIGVLAPTTCFVTYINHVEYSSTAEFAPLLERMLMVWKNETSDGWLPAVEKASLNLAFAMPDRQGRLHVRVAPAVRRNDKKQIIRLDLAARSPRVGGTIAEALDWIDLGHDWIVRGFASLTRPEMHKQWQRVQ